jgi:hypothetical protein
MDESELDGVAAVVIRQVGDGGRGGRSRNSLGNHPAAIARCYGVIFHQHLVVIGATTEDEEKVSMEPPTVQACAQDIEELDRPESSRRPRSRSFCWAWNGV